MKILPTCYAAKGAATTACGRPAHKVNTPFMEFVTCIRCRRVLAGKPIEWPDDEWE